MCAVVEHDVDDAIQACVYEGDLDQEAFRRACDASLLAWDIETTGLDWRTERIGTVQIHGGDFIFIVRQLRHRPHRLAALVENPEILKILHHAMFDLRFLASHWGLTPANVACTKIASKLCNPDSPNEDHSLAALTARYLGVTLDKTLRTSNWDGALEQAQLRYAAEDVRHLPALYERLDDELRQIGLLDLRDRCYAHLPTRVELEVGGFPDVFAY